MTSLGKSTSRKSFSNLFSLVVATVFINNFPVHAEEKISDNQDGKKTLESLNQATSKDQKKTLIK